MAEPPDLKTDDLHLRVAKLGFKQAIWVALIGLSSALLSSVATFYINRPTTPTTATPPNLGHFQCSFPADATECEAAARSTAQAVSASGTTGGGTNFFGTRGQAKFEVSCFKRVPTTADGELFFSIVVAGGGLKEVSDLKSQLRTTFVEKLRDQSTRSRFMERCLQ